MTMTRREFLKSAAVLAALSPFARLRAQEAPAEGAAEGGRSLTRRTMGGVSVPLLGYG